MLIISRHPMSSCRSQKFRMNACTNGIYKPEGIQSYLMRSLSLINHSQLAISIFGKYSCSLSFQFQMDAKMPF